MASVLTTQSYTCIGSTHRWGDDPFNHNITTRQSKDLALILYRIKFGTRVSLSPESGYFVENILGRFASLKYASYLCKMFARCVCYKYE